MMLALVFDPRYRSFPARRCVPALVYLCASGEPPPGDCPADLYHRCRHCAAVVPRRFANQQAWGWAVVSG
jgi:hypothetical protein